MSVPVLEMKEISKSFYGTQVLKNVSLTVGKGEIHCLVGENGAGTVSYTHLDVYKRQPLGPWLCTPRVSGF